MKNLTIFFAILFLAGCSVIELKQEDLNKIHRIGVISIIGNDIQIQKRRSLGLGLTFRGESFFGKQDLGWNINAFADKASRIAINKYSYITPVELAYNYKIFESMYDSDPFTSEIDTSNHEPYLKEAIKGKNVDAVLIISPCDCSDIVGGNTNDGISGYGIYAKDWDYRGMQYNTYSAIRLTLIDAKKYKIIATKKLVRAIYHKDRKYWSKDLMSLSKDIRMEIRKQISLLIYDSILSVLNEWKVLDVELKGSE